MIRNGICATFLMAVAVGVLTADEFFAEITKVDGNKVTYQKYEKGKKAGAPVTTEIGAGTTIAEFKRAPGARKAIAGKRIEGGLKNKLFPTAPGDKAVTAAIYTSRDNTTVKQILVVLSIK